MSDDSPQPEKDRGDAPAGSPEAQRGGVTRREFLEAAGTTVGGLVLAQALPLRLLQPLATIDNPLGFYPDRNWEKVYRDQYRYDSSFTFVCSPNDTHHCRLRAFVRNGVIMRIEQNYDVHRYADLYGNKRLEPPGLSEGLHLPPPRLRAVPAEVPDGTQGVETMGRRRLPRAHG